MLASAQAIKADIGGVNFGPAQVLFCDAGTFGTPWLYVQADFANYGQTPLTAVQLRFDLYDAFGTYLAGLSTQQTGTFTYGAKIANSGHDNQGNPLGWRIAQQWPDARRVECSVAKTLDVNGNVWTNRGLASPPPSPHP